MPRPKYPSDERHNEARRRPTFFKLHTSIQNHPKTIGLFADDALLAGYVRLGLLAIDRGAAQTGNEVSFSRADLRRVFGGADWRTCAKRLQTMCKLLAWNVTLKKQGTRIVCTLEFRNLARKQGLTPRNSGVNERKLRRSPLPSPLRSKEEEEEEPKSALVVSASPSPTCEEPQAVTLQEIVDGWQTICASRGAPAIRELTDDRKRKLKLRIREHPSFDWWNEVFTRMVASSFLFGDSERGWRASFDWLIANETNAVKILEGRYEAKKIHAIGANRGAMPRH